MHHICLLTPGNLASNPRLVKEAMALRDAGYSVRLVAADIIPSLAHFDDELIASLRVDCIRIPARYPRWAHAFRAGRQRAAKLVAQHSRGHVGLGLATFAQHQLTGALAKSAASARADLFIAHNLAALPAAAKAADVHRARLGFDAEDFHSGELEDTDRGGTEYLVRRAIEANLLPKCDYVTAAAPGIADAYAPDCRGRPEVILNVFPISEAPAEPVSLPRSHHLPSLYWFSQTIGPGRGLEQIVSAIGRMRTRVRLSLRGNPAGGYLDELRRLAYASGGEDLAARLEILSIAPPWEMVRLAAPHDLGLALELSTPPNRAVCLTNKIFTYLLAGVPVFLSNTAAQGALRPELGEAAMLMELDRPDDIARSFDDYFDSAARQQRARAEAWRLGQEKYNWEIEKQRFLRSIERVLNDRAAKN
jgi:hypothetical protein